MFSTPFYLTATNLTHPRLAHGFFGRQGGVSTGLLASLNVGYGTQDSRDRVDENRRRIRTALNATDLVTVYQIHSANVVPVSSKADLSGRSGEATKADALVTATPGLALGILTADCVPVLFADPVANGGSGVIGAAHAGWQGALGGITHRTLEAMLALGAKLQNIRCAIGPAIQQRSYEVGNDLRQKFLAQYKTNERFFEANARDTDRQTYQFDLPGYVHAQLVAAGVRQIENLGTDTYSDETSWFSYRRATHLHEPDYGRHMSVICLVK